MTEPFFIFHFTDRDWSYRKLTYLPSKPESKFDDQSAANSRLAARHQPQCLFWNPSYFLFFAEGQAAWAHDKRTEPTKMNKKCHAMKFNAPLMKEHENGKTTQLECMASTWHCIFLNLSLNLWTSGSCTYHVETATTPGPRVIPGIKRTILPWKVCVNYRPLPSEAVITLINSEAMWWLD